MLPITCYLITMINIQNYGKGVMFQWTKEYLIQVLTSGRSPIVTDPLLINALQKVDRRDFLPDTIKNQAYSDTELEIGYGEKLNKPTVVAQMLALLKPKYGGKYLDIGTGTGYSAMVMGFVAGDEGHVYTIDRVQWLWEQAKDYAKKYTNIKNVEFLYKDGMEGLLSKAPFDGIHISFALENVPENLKMQLKPGGRLIYPTIDMHLKVIERKDMENFEEESISGFIFDKGKEGIA